MGQEYIIIYIYIYLLIYHEFKPFHGSANIPVIVSFGAFGYTYISNEKAELFRVIGDYTTQLYKWGL